MHPVDLRVYKKELRQKAFERRKALGTEEKCEADRAILANVQRLKQYKSAHTVLVYVSLPAEVDTYGIINQCFADGKRVAVPRCVKDTRDMVFHYIDNTDVLCPGAFGVQEPDESLCSFNIAESEGVLMIVPALIADHYGFRLGYGKGYYDRYMSRFGGSTAIVCYSSDIRHRLLHGRFDVPAQVLVTEKYIRTTNY